MTVLDDQTKLTHISAIEADVQQLNSGEAPLDKIEEQDYKDFFARPRLIEQMTLPRSYINPNVIMEQWRALAPVNSMREQWGLFRGSPEITVSYTGSSSLMGLYRVFFYPANPTAYGPYTYGGFPTLNHRYFTPSTTSLLPHIDLDLSSSCTCSIKLPYVFNRQYNEWEPDWYYGVVGVNEPVNAQGGSVPGTTVSIYAAYHNVNLSRVQYQAGTEVVGGTLSKGLALASHLSKYVPFASPYTKLLELGAQAAVALGYSRAVEPTTVAMRPKPYSSLAPMMGEPSFGEVLGSSPLQTSAIGYEHLPGTGDDSIVGIAKKWSQVAWSWDTVRNLPVEPCYVTNTDDQLGFSLSAMGQMGIMFERWSGDIDVKVVVTGSPLVRWRLGVVVVQPGTPMVSTFPTDGTYETHIIEVAGTTEYNFTVKFIDKYAFRPIVIRNYDSATSGTENYTRLRFFSISVPAGPAATAVYPMVNVWWKAGDNFSFSIPTAKFLRVLEQYQSHLEVLQGANEIIEITSLGEKIDSLRTLAKRKMLNCMWTGVATNYNRFSLPADGYQWGGVDKTYNPALTSQFTISQAYFTFDSYIRSMFWGYTGGTAYSFWKKADDPWFFTTASMAPGAPGSDSARAEGFGRGAALAFPDYSKMMEIVVPDRQGYLYKKSIWNLPTTNTLLNPIECVEAMPVERSMPSNLEDWTVYQAAGDDRQFVLFLGVLRYLYN